MTTDLLKDLNPEQRAAVETTDGPVLVLSGAGTGKTRVLTTRIAYILQSGLAMPWQILALTFTNKAANEMKNRVADISAGSGINTFDTWLGTFHSVCLRILRYNADVAGIRRDFIVFGEDDQKAVIKSVIQSLNLDTKDFNPADYVEKIQYVKDKGLDPDADGLDKKSASTFKKIYAGYNSELARLGGVDFGDLILKVLELFTANPMILQKYQNQFKYIMVDEFQDTNRAQHQLLQLLAAGWGNICCVGDDDQSIYSWRGAEIKNILEFEREFPGATIIRLETNYRSSANILGAANSLIKNNVGRLGKDLRPADGANDGEKVHILYLPTDFDEARIIGDAIGNAGGGEFAILIRAGSLSRMFEEELARRNVPFRVVGTTKFYDRAEIRDAIAYARLLAYPFDDISFMRIISKPRRGFGAVALNNLREFATTQGTGMLDALRNVSLSGNQKKSADEFAAAFDFDWQTMRPADALGGLLEKSGYMNMWRESKDTDASDRLANVNELLTGVVSKYDTLGEFLEHAALMMTEDDEDTSHMQQGKNGDVVSIMTIHAAKGLEFDTVFMPAWEEGIFPNDKSFNDGGLEEERRLAYVAITRARKRAVITSTMSRHIFGQRISNAPSRFISEIDQKFVHQPPARNSGTVGESVRHKPDRTAYAGRTVYDADARVVGKMIKHSELGTGVVIEQSDETLTIAFRDKGIKKIKKEFVEFM